MLFEGVGHLQAAAVLRQQQAEVQGLALVAEIVREDGHHRLALDGRLHHGAGVDPDHRGAVIDRVEIVGPVVVVDGVGAVARIDHRSRILRRIGLHPVLEIRRVRTDQDGDVAVTRLQLAAKGRDPPLDEFDLGRRLVDLRGRAGEQDVGLVRRQSHLPAEFRP